MNDDKCELIVWTSGIRLLDLERGLSPAKSSECYATVMPLHGVKTRAGRFFLLPVVPLRPLSFLLLDSESSIADKHENKRKRINPEWIFNRRKKVNLNEQIVLNCFLLLSLGRQWILDQLYIDARLKWNMLIFLLQEKQDQPWRKDILLQKM